MNPKTEKLVAEFVGLSREFEQAFLHLGKLRWEIESAMGGESAFSMLVERGAIKSAVSNAKYGAAAYAAVRRGEITEAEFRQLAFDDCRLFAGVNGQVHSAPTILSLRKAHGIPADVAVCLAKAPVAAHELQKLTVEAKRMGYLTDGCGGELLRAVEMQAATGATTLPSRDALAERRASRTGDKGNLGALAFQLAKALGELPVADMPRESLVATHKLLLPVKSAIIRIEGLLREPEGKEAGNDRGGRSRGAAN